jgi:TRAP-type C4-dicarboxylate transport system permease small subunit
VIKFLLKALDTIPAWIEKATMLASVLMLIAMVGIMFLSTIFRYLLNSPWKWSEEALVFMLAWSIFILLGTVARRDEHVRIGFVMELLLGPEKAKRVWTVIENVLGLGVGIFLAYAGYTWLDISRDMGSISWSAAGFSYPQWVTRIVPTLGLSLLAFFYLERNTRMIIAFFAARRSKKPADFGDMA